MNGIFIHKRSIALLSFALCASAINAQQSSTSPATGTGESPSTTPQEEYYPVTTGTGTPSQGVVQHYSVNESRIKDVHLRYGQTTAIRTPSAVELISVGDQQAFMAEHSPEDATILLVKPTGPNASSSNMFVHLEDGKVLNFRLISDANPNTPVDYFIDVHAATSMFVTPHHDDGGDSTVITATKPLPVGGGSAVSNVSGLTGTPSIHAANSAALVAQQRVATPQYLNAKQLAKLVMENQDAPNTLALALGTMSQHGEYTTVSYSVMNISQSLVEVLPPQIEYTNPHAKKLKKNLGARAEQVPLEGYLTTTRKLQPGQRCDGVITFLRPDFKQYEEKILLQIASSAAVDYPLMMPLPFVAEGVE